MRQELIKREKGLKMPSYRGAMELAPDFEETEIISSIFVNPIGTQPTKHQVVPDRSLQPNEDPQRRGILTPPSIRASEFTTLVSCNTPIGSYLSSLRLEMYTSKMKQEGYDEAGDLEGMCKDELIEIGVKAGHAQRILNALRIGLDQHPVLSPPTLQSTTATTNIVPQPMFDESEREASFSPVAISEFSVDAGCVSAAPEPDYQLISANLADALSADQYLLMSTIIKSNLKSQHDYNSVSHFFPKKRFNGILHKALEELPAQRLDNIKEHFSEVGIVVDWTKKQTAPPPQPPAPVRRDSVSSVVSMKRSDSAKQHEMDLINQIKSLEESLREKERDHAIEMDKARDRDTEYERVITSLKADSNQTTELEAKVSQLTSELSHRDNQITDLSDKLEKAAAASSNSEQQQFQFPSHFVDYQSSLFNSFTAALSRLAKISFEAEYTTSEVLLNSNTEISNLKTQLAESVAAAAAAAADAAADARSEKSDKSSKSSKSSKSDSSKKRKDKKKAKKEKEEQEPEEEQQEPNEDVKVSKEIPEEPASPEPEEEEKSPTEPEPESEPEPEPEPKAAEEKQSEPEEEEAPKQNVPSEEEEQAKEESEEEPAQEEPPKEEPQEEEPEPAQEQPKESEAADDEEEEEEEDHFKRPSDLVLDFALDAFSQTFNCLVPTRPWSDHIKMWKTLCEKQEGAVFEDWAKAPFPGLLKYRITQFYSMTPAGGGNAEGLTGKIMAGARTMEVLTEELCAKYPEPGTLECWQGDYPSALRDEDSIDLVFQVLREQLSGKTGEVGEVHKQVLYRKMSLENALQKLSELEDVDINPSHWLARNPKSCIKYILMKFFEQHRVEDEHNIDHFKQETEEAIKQLSEEFAFHDLMAKLCQERSEMGASIALWQGAFPLALQKEFDFKQWLLERSIPEDKDIDYNEILGLATSEGDVLDNMWYKYEQSWQLSDEHFHFMRFPLVVRFTLDAFYISFAPEKLTLVYDLVKKICDDPDPEQRLHAILGRMVQNYGEQGAKLPDWQYTDQHDPLGPTEYFYKRFFELQYEGAAEEHLQKVPQLVQAVAKAGREQSFEVKMNQLAAMYEKEQFRIPIEDWDGEYPFALRDGW